MEEEEEEEEDAAVAPVVHMVCNAPRALHRWFRRRVCRVRFIMCVRQTVYEDRHHLPPNQYIERVTFNNKRRKQNRGLTGAERSASGVNSWAPARLRIALCYAERRGVALRCPV
ncbi:unnamed protein product [Pleuronectes platessa]|uniref:Uncharacterized protein n=1 Tax=Pleuronectes platessa TaxID=8262 RepID=A0A9N7TYS0_PLEPL|nr:unnamed protein product [Pleuronectes platessa]